MKSIFVLFLFVSYLTNFALANSTADIICSTAVNENYFSIDTRNAKVWYNEIHEVNGPVFSGVHSPKEYVGEILGEIDLHETGYYLTLIMRNRDEKPQLEAIWYPKNGQKKVIRYFLENCQLK